MKIKHAECYVKDYPRPQLVRDGWVNLNGKWDFCFDDGKVDTKSFNNGFSANMQINVPFAYQCKASGIGDPTQYPAVWYQRNINVKFAEDERVLLHLEGSDYKTEVFVNGVSCGVQKGAYHRLTFDLTSACVQGDNKLVIKVEDSYDPAIARGKQRSLDKDYGCWYVGISGIYKTAWLETVNKYSIEGLKLVPMVSTNVIAVLTDIGPIDEDFLKEHEVVLASVVRFDGNAVSSLETRVANPYPSHSIWLGEDKHLWEVLNPCLYDLTVTLKIDGEIKDTVGSYFGMREIKYSDGKILLNDKPLYQKLILDQGYWEDTNLTPPSEEALEKDIDDMIKMGFNGCRKHQKVEDERFLYHADIRGYIVWAEMPSSYTYVIDKKTLSCAATYSEREQFAKEWGMAVLQQYNHACVLCWVPINESWGVEDVLFDTEEQNYINRLYEYTYELDGTRPVITNDGWEHTVSDYLTIHHYTQKGDELQKFFASVDKCTQRIFDGHHKGAFANSYSYQGQPILISEFGGTSFVKDLSGNKWGYGEAVASDEEFIERFRSLIRAIYKNEHIQGFCYTQLSDVYHEVNGLMTFDRKPKEPFEVIKEILDEGPVTK